MGTETTTGPRVWVGCLACYNGGDLVGDWLEAADGPAYVPEGHDVGCLRCGATEGTPGFGLMACPGEPATSLGYEAGEHYRGIRGPDGSAHEEQWVMDHEGFGGLLEGECSPSQAAEVAEAVERFEAEGFPIEAVAAWRDSVGAEYADLESTADFADAYCGEWGSGADYAAQTAEELGAFSVYGGDGGSDRPTDVSDRWPFTCIDWDRAWRELELGDGYYTAEAPGGVYVLRST